MAWAYLFEAKGIQRYTFDSGPLRDLVGARDLIAWLAFSDGKGLIGEVGEVLRQTWVNIDDVTFSPRGSGACSLNGDKENQERVPALWHEAGLRRAEGRL